MGVAGAPKMLQVPGNVGGVKGLGLENGLLNPVLQAQFQAMQVSHRGGREIQQFKERTGGTEQDTCTVHQR